MNSTTTSEEQGEEAKGGEEEQDEGEEKKSRWRGPKKNARNRSFASSIVRTACVERQKTLRTIGKPQ